MKHVISRSGLIFSVLLCATLPTANVGAQHASGIIVISQELARMSTPSTTMLDYATGSEFEDYLRVLQVAGLTGLYPWSLRGFSPTEIQRLAAADTAGPWRLSQRLRLGGATAGPVTVRTTFNTSYAYGSNDGPVWAGRGITVAVSGGVAARIGPFSATFAPVAFSSRNQSFPLLPDSRNGLFTYANGTQPEHVDAPQRFGPKAYSRVDFGASTARFDTRFITVGVSTANEWIGPATEYPFLLGTNAPGFPHLFAGTGDPLNLWITRVHARVAWGKLYQSEYSPVTGTARYTSPANSGTERLATYATAVFMPRGVPGLELGFSRFIHVPYRAGDPTAEFWKKPFKVLFLENEYAAGDSTGTDNQLASAFFRWVFPQSGFELFGERGFEDHFYDRRDLVQRPDHERAYSLGFQKILKSDPSSLQVLRGELINYDYPGTVYLHAQLRQGHTNRGQLMGAGAGIPNGAASILSWTRYASTNRSTVALRRIVRAQKGEYVSLATADSQNVDVLMAIAAERMRMGERIDLGARIEVMQNFHRNFSDDAANLNLQLTARLKRW